MTHAGRLVACALAAMVLTGCAATGGPRRTPTTELELKQPADRRVCGKQTRGFRFIPPFSIVRTVEYDKCMLRRGWDVLSARDRQAAL